MFEFFKERHLAAIFFSTLMVLFGALALGWMIHELTAKNMQPGDWALVFACIGLFLVVVAWLCFWQWRRRGRMGRYKSTPLSDDERVKARRKLAVKPMVNKR